MTKTNGARMAKIVSWMRGRVRISSCISSLPPPAYLNEYIDSTPQTNSVQKKPKLAAQIRQFFNVNFVVVPATLSPVSFPAGIGVLLAELYDWLISDTIFGLLLFQPHISEKVAGST